MTHCSELLHDHLLLSVRGQGLDGAWGSIHTTALYENTVAVSALYNEFVAAEVCEELGLATEPRTVTSAILTSGFAADVITSLLEYARAAAATIRARVAAVVDVAATVFVMNDGGTLTFSP
ncbi:hypothetical protein AMK21_31115 [Streptomyces sp. CB00316]|uniref:relaxase domain-containing protein n=1 Tax=Streptomyces sp. CB00316 TaxID=1703932 RepID=UPI00095BC534|nr:relaxase domain-containing protein [Streptomyces sp. CB00316]OKJ10083.1 hypothetical protein AMK21_31115 [Streptomyces sp. CB00316]